MTTPVTPLLADAITTAINVAVEAEEFETLGFEAERTYPDWDDSFEDLKDLAVDVVPVMVSEVVDLDSYESTDLKPAVDIAIRKRIEPGERLRPGAKRGRVKPSVVDALIRLGEQLREKFESERMTPIDLGGGLYANWIESEIRTQCDYKELREGRFLGVSRIKYDVSKVV